MCVWMRVNKIIVLNCKTVKKTKIICHLSVRNEPETEKWSINSFIWKVLCERKSVYAKYFTFEAKILSQKCRFIYRKYIHNQNNIQTKIVYLVWFFRLFKTKIKTFLWIKIDFWLTENDRPCETENVIKSIVGSHEHFILFRRWICLISSP